MNYVKQFIRDLSIKSNRIQGNIYLVGGYIRDKLINPKNEPENADFVYSGNIKILIESLKDSGYNFLNIKNSFSEFSCLVGKNIINISEIKGNSILEDLQNRDFTVNAIAMKVGENKIIDPFYGKRAIKNRIIKMISKNSFNNDPVRIIRAVRLYISLGMHFNKETEDMLKNTVYKIADAPKKRLYHELMLTIEKDTEGEAFEIMDTFCILKYLIPYSEELKTIGKCKYHIEDVLTHSNLTYKTFKDIVKGRICLKGLDLSVFDIKIEDFTVKEYTALTCFLHDIGKYKAYKNEDGRVSFSGHEQKGKEICRAFCCNLEFPKEASVFIEMIVEAHMYPLMYFKNNMKYGKQDHYKFFKKYDKISKFILIVSFCDNYATRMLMDTQNEKEAFKTFIEDMIHECDVYFSK